MMTYTVNIFRVCIMQVFLPFFATNCVKFFLINAKKKKVARVDKK